MLRTLIAILWFASPVGALAESTYLQVGEARAKKPSIALTGGKAASASESGLVEQIDKRIRTDLEFVDSFRLLERESFVKGPALDADGKPDSTAWIQAGADHVATGSFSRSGAQAVYEFRLFSTASKSEILSKKYLGDPSSPTILAHTIANDIVRAITGKQGIFLTRIAFVCDKTGKKEIYSSSFDGSDIRQITRLRSLAMAPAWSPDGTRIAFSVYNRHSDNTKNLDLFEYDFKSGRYHLLSNRKGINSGAAYSPKGDRIAYTMSVTGNPEIHLLDTSTRETTQLTRSIGFDVDPAFSPDGKQLAFVSSRPGKPMLYTLEIDRPADAKRLTYAGNYNATPSWSPDGKKIAFAGWLDGKFDLFTITSDGGKIERLTKDEGNNEDPHFSPDGNFLVFSSTRSGGKNVFLMGAGGGNVKRLTLGMGECVAPKWSPYL
jgi:TolB protein